jgi:hypothetical protein
MVPGMDLQTQYDKTLQNTIGQSQRQRNEAIRQSQGGATDWEQRGASGFRGAGYNEVNPSTMPAMDETTREYLSPILGTYQEGGKNQEGYYGDLNPYTVEGALKYASNAGFTDADSTLQQQAKETGQTLPSLFGHSLANDAARTWSGNYSNWKNQQQVQQQQTIDNNPFASFTPGQDNGNWKWQSGAGPSVMNLMTSLAIDARNKQRESYNLESASDILNQDRLSFDERFPMDADTQWAQDYLNTVSPAGSGTWFNDKDPMHGIDYRPNQGYNYTAYDSAPKGFNKYMPALTMAALGAMSGGAGYAAMGGAAAGTSALAGQALGAAIPSTMHTGLTTGDWGNALKTGAISGAGSFLGGAYGKGLGEAMNLSGQTAANVGKGLIGAGTNLAGNALMGRNIDWAGALGAAAGNIGGSYLGDLASNSIGGTLGEATGGGIKALSKGLSGSLAAGKGLDLRDIATRTALGVATPTLGSLFSDSNQTPEERNQPTKLASTLANTVYKNNKRL